MRAFGRLRVRLRRRGADRVQGARPGGGGVLPQPRLPGGAESADLAAFSAPARYHATCSLLAPQLRSLEPLLRFDRAHLGHAGLSSLLTRAAALAQRPAESAMAQPIDRCDRWDDAAAGARVAAPPRQGEQEQLAKQSAT